MKSFYFAVVFITAGFFAQAQEKKAAVKTSAESSPIAKEAVVTGFEATLADGKIRFVKKVDQSGTGALKVTYLIRNKSNNTFNNGQPYEIQLDQSSFTNYFQKSAPELAQKLPLVIRYAQDNKLSFSDEQGWAKLIYFYNNLD